MVNFPLLSSGALRINPKQLMRRKAAKSINIPPRLYSLSRSYAESNQRSLSSLIEDLLRRHLEANGVNPNLSLEQFMEQVAEKFGLNADELKKQAGGECSAEL
jgi:hypothetical protein